MIKIYEKTFKIEMSHCDCFGRLKVSELFKFMQECAMNHAELMGEGMIAVHNIDSTFVLSRMKINVLTMPSYGEVVTIKTYPDGVERLFYIRGFEISINGVKVAKARSMWLLINFKTRRLVRVRDFDRYFPQVDFESVRMVSPKKPVVQVNAPELLNRIVGYSDVDIIGHANNTCYIAWVSDCIGSEFFKDNPSYSLVINYSSELSEGECVRIIGEDMTYSGYNESGRESFSAKLERL